MLASSSSSLMTHDVMGYAELCRPGAADYLARHRIPQLFRSLVAALMIEQPADHVAFIKRTLARAMEVGVQNLDWETFVYALHPMRSPERLEYIRDGTRYERQGVELMERRLRRGENRCVLSPPPPPLSPAPSLTSTVSGGGGGGAGDLFRLTQGQWEDSTVVVQPLPPPAPTNSDHRPRSAGSAGSSDSAAVRRRRLDQLSTPEAQEFVSDEVDRLLGEAIVMSVAARDAASASSRGSGGSEAQLAASLHAKLLLDTGRSDVGPGIGEVEGEGEDEGEIGFGLFD